MARFYMIALTDESLQSVSENENRQYRPLSKAENQEQ